MATKGEVTNTAMAAIKEKQIRAQGRQNIRIGSKGGRETTRVAQIYSPRYGHAAT